MNFKRAIIAYLPHKRTQNARNKKIIFFAIMKPLKADNAKQNRQSKHKKGAYYHGKQKQSEREI
ncbi:restriction endonuclease subunit M [Helicobacter pylori]|nr:restriction endonuclease subunit M [Helicobacter pylori]